MIRTCNICGKQYEESGGPAYVCPQCLADAKLGRLVRRMREDMVLTPGFKSGNEPPWLCFWGPGERYSASGNIPEEALEKAMGEVE